MEDFDPMSIFSLEPSPPLRHTGGRPEDIHGYAGHIRICRDIHRGRIVRGHKGVLSYAEGRYYTAYTCIHTARHNTIAVLLAHAINDMGKHLV